MKQNLEQIEGVINILEEEEEEKALVEIVTESRER